MNGYGRFSFGKHLAVFLNKSIYALVSLVLPLLFSSCEHKDLCYDHEAHTPHYDKTISVSFVNDWQFNFGAQIDWALEWSEQFDIPYDSLRPKLPKGIRVRVYREDGYTVFYNYPATGGRLRISEPKDHSLLFYNNDTEYVVFNELEDYATAQATTRTRSRAGYDGNPLTRGDIVAEYTVGEPDMLYGTHVDNFNPGRLVANDTLEVLMHPLVFTYLIRYEFKHGLDYVLKTRGALSGMARSVYLNTGKTLKEEATILFEGSVESWGTQSVVRSWGVPDFPNPDYSRGDRKHGLTLEVTLKNGLRKNYYFDVTDQVEKQPHGGVIIVKDIEVPDEAGQAGGGGFHVEVDDWENHEYIEVPL